MDLCETHIIGRDTHEWAVGSNDCNALRQSHISGTGFSDVVAPYSMIRARPPHLHLLICTGGEGMVLLGNRWKPCGEGQAYLSPPGELMGFHPQPKKRWKLVWIFYTAPAATRLFPQPRGELRGVDPSVFESSVRGLHRESQSQRDEAVMASWTHLLHTACLRLLRTPEAQFRLHPLWQKVEGKPSYPWTMGLLAREAGVSEEHLRRMSWKENGRSPIKQVTFLRLQRATLLLQTTSLTISAIAEVVGYKNEFAFSTAFKRHFGCSPSLYLSRQNQSK